MSTNFILIKFHIQIQFLYIGASDRIIVWLEFSKDR